MLQACEERLRADRRVVRFVIPFSVTLSANGSATFIACSCLFIANFSGQYPTVGTILIVGYVTFMLNMTTLALKHNFKTLHCRIIIYCFNRMENNVTVIYLYTE